MRRSAISFVHVRRQCAPCARRVSNCLASCCATAGTTTDRPGRSCTGAGWQASSSTRRYIILCWRIVSRRSRQRWHGATDWRHISKPCCRSGLSHRWLKPCKPCAGCDWWPQPPLVAELGDITRFTNPRQLMAYLGLVPSEHSSGRTRRQGGITKAGNGAARRMLIEAAWSYRFPARISREQLLRQERLAKPIRDIAWKAQERLCPPYRALARAGKLPTVITAAIARELVGFIWAIAKQIPSAAS